MYAINVDKPTHIIRIHDGSCPTYIYWNGVKKPANGGWSLCDTEAKALARAKHEGSKLTWAKIEWPRCHCPAPRSHKV